MSTNGDPVVLVGGVRTAIGRFGGALKDVDAHELGAAAIRELLARTGVDPGEVDEVVMGQVGQVGPGRLQRTPLRDRGRDPAERHRDERQPPLLLGAAGDPDRSAGDPDRPGRRRRRRRGRVDEPPAVPRLPRARRIPAGPARAGRRHALARHRPVRPLPDGRDRRDASPSATGSRARSRTPSRREASGSPAGRSRRAGSTREIVPVTPPRADRAVRARRASAPGDDRGDAGEAPARLPARRLGHGRQLGRDQRRRRRRPAHAGVARRSGAASRRACACARGR